MNTPTVSQMKGLVDAEQGLLDRQNFFSQEIYQQTGIARRTILLDQAILSSANLSVFF